MIQCCAVLLTACLGVDVLLRCAMLCCAVCPQAVLLVSLAAVVEEQGRLEEAEQQLRQGVEMCQQVLGSHHPTTGLATRNLGMLLFQQGKWVEAEQALWRALKMARCGAVHIWT